MGCLVYGPRCEEVRGKWRKPRELNDLNCTPNIVRVIKLRRMKRAERVPRMGEKRGVYRVFLGICEGRDHLEERGLDGRIILRWIFG
jgi:hypothetical protein